MEIPQIVKALDEILSKVNEIKEMIVDFDNCKNQTSKQYLLAAINKMTAAIIPSNSAIR